MLEQALDRAATPGACVAVLRDGRPVGVHAAGWADPARTTPLAVDTRWYIYSVTKTLIAALILQRAEQGALALDAPVQSYLPHLALDQPVTVRQLLNHTGGLPDYGGLPAYAAALKADPTTPWDDATFLTATLAQGMLFAPGQGWAYSNLGYMLLRQVLTAVCSQSFRALVAEQIVAPLGLERTGVVDTLADAQDLTPGWSSFLSPDGALADVHTRYHPGWVAHGVVGSTALELARIVDAIGSARLISPESRAAMLEAVPVAVQHPLFRQPSYGLGVMIDPAARYGVLFGHGGGGPGYTIGAVCLPNAAGRRITAVATANRDQPDLGLQLAFEAAMFAAEQLDT
jgi:D-alanyl-D-alanine carboxypeptidase